MEGKIKEVSVRLSQINVLLGITNLMMIAVENVNFTHYWERHIKYSLNENEYLIIEKFWKLEKTKAHFIVREPVEGKKRGMIRKDAKSPIFYLSDHRACCMEMGASPKGQSKGKPHLVKCLLKARRVLNVLNLLPHLILSAVLWNSRYYCHCFINRGRRSEVQSNCPQSLSWG